MGSREKELAIILRSKLDGSGFSEFKGALDSARTEATKVGQATNNAMKDVANGVAIVGTKTGNSLKKMSFHGRLAFKSIGLAASQAGSSLGPLVPGVNTVFSALAAGGPVMIATTTALAGLGWIISKIGDNSKATALKQKELEESVARTGVASLKMYDDLSKLQGGLTQTQARMRDFQRELGEGMVPVFNIVTGQWEKIAAVSAQSVGDTVDNVNLMHRSIEQIFSQTKGVEYYENAINDIKNALEQTSDVVLRGNLARELKALNDELSELKSPDPIKGSLAAIRIEWQNQVVTLEQLNGKKRIAAEFIQSTDFAIQAFGLEQLKAINDQIAKTVSIAEGIKPEDQLAGRPRGGRRADISEEEAERRGRMNVASMQSEWEYQLIQMGVDRHLAAEIAKTSSSWEQAQERSTLLKQEEQEFLQHTQFLQQTWGFAVNTMTDAKMTGSERMKRIGEQLKNSAIQQIGQEIQADVLKHAFRKTAMVSTLGVQTTTAATGVGIEQAAAGATTSSWLATAAAKVYAFYASLGPFGIPAAVATVGLIIAAVRGIGAMKFAEGGIVPGAGFGDRVPAMLEPGEGIVRRSAMQSNPGVVQALNSGKSIGGGNTIVNNINLDGEGLTLQRKIEIRDLVESFMAPMFERMLDDRRFSVSYGT